MEPAADQCVILDSTNEAAESTQPSQHPQLSFCPAGHTTEQQELHHALALMDDSCIVFTECGVYEWLKHLK